MTSGFLNALPKIFYVLGLMKIQNCLHSSSFLERKDGVVQTSYLLLHLIVNKWVTKI